MLENLSYLHKNDSELKLLPSVRVIGKLSKWNYVMPLLNMLMLILQMVALFIFKKDLLAFVKNLLSKIHFLFSTKYNAILSFENVFMFFDVLLFWIFPAYLAIKILSKILDCFRIAFITLIVDDYGVWQKSRLFSFTKDISGAVWQNINLAKTKNNMIFHYFKIYPIEIENRFTGNSEIKIKPLKNGAEILKIINEEVQKILLK